MVEQSLRQNFLARTALTGNQYRCGRPGDAIGLGQQPCDLGILGDELHGGRPMDCIWRIGSLGNSRWIDFSCGTSVHNLRPFRHILCTNA